MVWGCDALQRDFPGTDAFANKLQQNHLSVRDADNQLPTLIAVPTAKADAALAVE